jgi:hypothetical protein
MGPDGSWKIDHLDFACKGHEEFISRTKIAVEPPTPSTKKKQQNKTTVPNSVINEWGVPPRVYHMLQVREQDSVCQPVFLIIMLDFGYRTASK